MLLSLKVVEICWWKTYKSVKKTFHSTFSRICWFYRRVTENHFVRVSKSSPTITIFWAFIYIICIAFFDISFLGVACAEVIFRILNRSRSDRRSKWNVFKSIEIMQWMCVLMLLWKCCNLCTYYVLAFPITNLHLIFFVSKWSRSWRERKSGKKSSTKHIKEFVWRLYIKFSCQVLILKSFHQDFV